MLIHSSHTITSSHITHPYKWHTLTQLYPRYTYGPPGVYSTKEGQVTVTDMKIVHNKRSKVISTPSTTLTPSPDLTALNNTDDQSQGHSQPCDMQPMSHDHLLVEGSLMDIERHNSHTSIEHGGGASQHPSESQVTPHTVSLG